MDWRFRASSAVSISPERRDILEAGAIGWGAVVPMDVGPSELLWVIIVLAVLFGASRLPAMGRNLGLGIKEFKRGLSEAVRDGDQSESEPRRSGGQERGAST